MLVARALHASEGRLQADRLLPLAEGAAGNGHTPGTATGISRATHTTNTGKTPGCAGATQASVAGSVSPGSAAGVTGASLVTGATSITAAAQFTGATKAAEAIDATQITGATQAAGAAPDPRHTPGGAARILRSLSSATHAEVTTRQRVLTIICPVRTGYHQER